MSGDPSHPGPSAPTAGFDVFLSHGSPDKPFVRSLGDALTALGLRVFLDERELKAGENWTLRLSDELLHSRAMALVISAETLKRPWVEHEWTSFLATHGPTSGRLIPVLLDNVALPPFLSPIQAVKGLHRDPAKIADELLKRIGRPGTLPEGDARRLEFGQDLVFVLEPAGDDTLAIIDPAGPAPRGPGALEDRSCLPCRTDRVRPAGPPAGGERLRPCRRAQARRGPGLDPLRPALRCQVPGAAPGRDAAGPSPAAGDDPQRRGAPAGAALGAAPPGWPVPGAGGGARPGPDRHPGGRSRGPHSPAPGRPPVRAGRQRVGAGGGRPGTELRDGELPAEPDARRPVHDDPHRAGDAGRPGADRGRGAAPRASTSRATAARAGSTSRTTRARRPPWRFASWSRR